MRTVERALRQGYACRVVQSALDILLEQGYIPHYQVEATNLPSVRLAETIGLVLCLRFEHYLASSSR